MCGIGISVFFTFSVCLCGFSTPRSKTITIWVTGSSTLNPKRCGCVSKWCVSCVGLVACPGCVPSSQGNQKCGEAPRIKARDSTTVPKQTIWCLLLICKDVGNLGIFMQQRWFEFYDAQQAQNESHGSHTLLFIPDDPSSCQQILFF